MQNNFFDNCNKTTLSNATLFTFYTTSYLVMHYWNRWRFMGTILCVITRSVIIILITYRYILVRKPFRNGTTSKF